MWLETAVESLKEVPEMVSGSLAQITKLDRANGERSKSLAKQEQELLEHVKNCIRDDVPFDEEEVKAKADALVQQRAALVTDMNAQAGISQTLYTFLDTGINAMDKNISHLNSVFAGSISGGGGAQGMFSSCLSVSYPFILSRLLCANSFYF